MVSHDTMLLDHWCDRVLRLDAGRLTGPARRGVPD
jgi:ATPase subunit of ABC transporter with duplicated ATPase domains